MASRPLPDRMYSLNEYLDLEDEAESKHEFHAGYIVAMAGGTETHSRLSLRTGAVLDRHLTKCRTYDSNLKLFVEQANRIFYPDAMVLCGEPRFVKGRNTVIDNPTVVVKVLSPSSVKRDRGSKSDYYRSVPSLEHILLISQDAVLVDHFKRQSSDGWSIARYQSTAAVIRLWDAEIPVAEIYDRILI